MCIEKENVIEFLTGDETCTMTFNSKKYVNKIQKLYKDHPEEFIYLDENDDGSICCKLPVKWVKISPPKKISEAQRRAASERFIKMHRDRENNTNTCNV